MLDSEHDNLGVAPLQGLDWMLDGICASTDPELWFPGPENDITSSKDAKRLCLRCPVKEECLEYAIHAKTSSLNGETSYVVGVWGGTTAGQRSKIRLRRGLTTWKEQPKLDLYTEGGDDEAEALRHAGTACEREDDLGEGPPGF